MKHHIRTRYVYASQIAFLKRSVGQFKPILFVCTMLQLSIESAFCRNSRANILDLIYNISSGDIGLGHIRTRDLNRFFFESDFPRNLRSSVLCYKCVQYMRWLFDIEFPGRYSRYLFIILIRDWANVADLLDYSRTLDITDTNSHHPL